MTMTLAAKQRTASDYQHMLLIVQGVLGYVKTAQRLCTTPRTMNHWFHQWGASSEQCEELERLYDEIIPVLGESPTPESRLAANRVFAS